MLQELFAKAGKNIYIEPTFRWDYGCNIVIGDNVWIGGDAVINLGISVGNNVIIDSGSVVVKSIPDNVIAEGNPCKVIREISE